MRENVGKYSVGTMLEILDLKRSYWDRYKNVRPKIAVKEEAALQAIAEVFNSNLKQYGYRRITSSLKEAGIIVNHKRVLRIMNANGIRAQYVRKMRNSARIRKGIRASKQSYPDLVQRNYSGVTTRFSVLYTDVTQFNLGGRRLYQSTIIDGFTKEIIDYKISPFNDLKLVLDNLRDAVAKIKQTKSNLHGTIIHSDHGSQYTSNAYKTRCETDNLIISMGAAYTCADNIVIESFHALLKKGTLHNNDYQNINEYLEGVLIWNN